MHCLQMILLVPGGPYMALLPVLVALSVGLLAFCAWVDLIALGACFCVFLALFLCQSGPNPLVSATIAQVQTTGAQCSWGAHVPGAVVLVPPPPGEECGICLEVITPALATHQSTATALPCGHKLHNACLHALLFHGQTRCPICRSSMDFVL